MKDEIKEIKISKSNHSIVIIKNGVTVKEQFAIDDEILDYITNLQENNKSLQANVKLLDDNRIYLNDKIDKAIEYIEYYCIGNNTIENKSHKTLLNILQGEDKDEFQENVNK